VFWICLGYGVNMRDGTMRAAAEQRLLKLTIEILSCQEKMQDSAMNFRWLLLI
jgi:hypothetical protein